jgi:hypothetical protein
LQLGKFSRALFEQIFLVAAHGAMLTQGTLRT